MMLGQLDIHMLKKQMNLDFYLTQFEINSIIHPNVETEIVKRLEENTGENLCDLK